MKNKKTREEIESAAAKSYSIAGVCRLLKLVPSGGNYRIIHNAIEKYKIDTSHFTGQGIELTDHAQYLKFDWHLYNLSKDIDEENDKTKKKYLQIAES